MTVTVEVAHKSVDGDCFRSPRSFVVFLGAVSHYSSSGFINVTRHIYIRTETEIGLVVSLVTLFEGIIYSVGERNKVFGRGKDIRFFLAAVAFIFGDRHGRLNGLFFPVGGKSNIRRNGSGLENVFFAVK